MTLVRTADLTGAALDWAVAAACDLRPQITHVCCGSGVQSGYGSPPECCGQPDSAVLLGEHSPWRPSQDWAQCGPLVDAHDVSLVGGERKHPGRKRLAVSAIASAYGPDNLIAACRCIVWGLLGKTVDVPEELV